MSFENKGAMTAVAVVTHVPDRSGNFVIEAGVDPAVVIEAAWAYLNTFGGGTLVTKGAGQTWDIQTTIDSQGDRVTWLSDKSLVIRAGVATTLVSVTHDDFTADGVHLDGDKASHAANYYGFDLTGDRWHIKNCEVHDIDNTSWGGNGIRASGCVGGEAESNHIYDNGDPAVADGGMAIVLINCTDCIATDNFIHDNNAGIYIFAQGDGDETLRCKANDNWVSGSQRDGIAFYPLHENGLVARCIADGNILVDNGKDTLHTQIKLGSNGTCVDNVVSNNILMETGDTVCGVGLHIFTNSTGNTICGNVFYNTYDSCMNIYGDRNAIIGNIFDTARAPATLVKVRAGGDGNSFSGNMFLNIAANLYGLSMEGSDTLISGNYYYGSTNANGILIDDGGDNLIDGDFFDLPRYGVAIDGDSDNNVIRNCKMTGASKGIFIVAATANNTVIAGCDFRGCTLPLDDGGTDTVLPSREWLATYGTNGISVTGDVPLAALANGESAAVGFEAPPDLQQLVRAYLKVLPQATQASADWDLNSDYGGVGEAPNVHSETDAATTYNVTNNQWYDIELVALGFFANLAVGDRGGIRMTISTAGHGASVFSLLFEYV